MNFEKVYEALEEANDKQSRFLSPLRYSIVTTQLADIGSRITHDPKVNIDDDLNEVEPRPFGSYQEEIHAFGHTFANLIMLAQNRGISPEELTEGLDHAVESLTDKDWEASEPSPDGRIVGLIASDGGYDSFTGDVVNRDGPHTKGAVLVVDHFRPEDTPIAHKVGAIVTGHGGFTSHAANFAREHHIPCIVDTGNAVEELELGDEVEINLKTGEVFP